MIPKLVKIKKEKQIAAFSNLQKIIVYYFNTAVIDEIASSLDDLGTNLDEKMSVIKHLNSAVENVQKIIKSKGNVEPALDPQTFLAKIDHCLFRENYDDVTINPQDYQELFIKNSDKLVTRYEPEVMADMLKLGIVGYLHGPKGELAKTIKISRLIESGRVSISKEI
jgi:hypothetical protein